jgi:hypothetical protein
MEFRMPEESASSPGFTDRNLPAFFHERYDKPAPWPENTERLKERPGNVIHKADNGHHQDTIKCSAPVREGLSHAKDGFHPAVPGHREQPYGGIETVTYPEPGCKPA